MPAGQGDTFVQHQVLQTVDDAGAGWRMTVWVYSFMTGPQGCPFRSFTLQ